MGRAPRARALATTRLRAVGRGELGRRRLVLEGHGELGSWAVAFSPGRRRASRAGSDGPHSAPVGRGERSSGGRARTACGQRRCVRRRAGALGGRWGRLPPRSGATRGLERVYDRRPTVDLFRRHGAAGWRRDGGWRGRPRGEACKAGRPGCVARRNDSSAGRTAADPATGGARADEGEQERFLIQQQQLQEEYISRLGVADVFQIERSAASARSAPSPSTGQGGWIAGDEGLLLHCR